LSALRLSSHTSSRYTPSLDLEINSYADSHVFIVYTQTLET